MLQSVVEHLKLNANVAMSKVIGRVIVAVAFVIAAAFAVAAIAVWLIQSVGAVAAYAILAAAFAFLGVVAAAFVAVHERHQETILRESKATRAAMVSSLTSLTAASPLALAGSLKGLQKIFRGRGSVAMLLLVAAGLLLRRSATGHDATHDSTAHNNSHAGVH